MTTPSDAIDRMQVLWDFHGPQAEATAEHFLHHLRERLATEAWPAHATGTESAGPGHCAAFAIVDAPLVPAIRAALRPQRGLPVTASA